MDQRIDSDLVRLTTSTLDLAASALRLKTENERLTDALKVAVAAIENAPHDTRGFGCRGIGDCNCWKAKVLSRIQESGGKP